MSKNETEQLFKDLIKDKKASKKNLTEKQEKFISYLFSLDPVDFDFERLRIEEAKIKAGYSKDYPVSNILKSINNAPDYILEEAIIKASTHIPEAIEKTVEIMRGEKPQQYAGASLKAAEMLTGWIGLVKDKKEDANPDKPVYIAVLPEKKYEDDE